MWKRDKNAKDEQMLMGTEKSNTISAKAINVVKTLRLKVQDLNQDDWDHHLTLLRQVKENLKISKLCNRVITNLWKLSYVIRMDKGTVW